MGENSGKLFVLAKVAVAHASDSLESAAVPEDPSATPSAPGSTEVVAADGSAVTPAGDSTIEQPAKLLRIAVMIRELLEEVRRAPVDENAREHLREIHGRVLTELKTGLPDTLREELDRITMPLNGTGVPTESEIRIAQAQLLGWLEGLFQGIQAAIATQQMAAAAQLEEMRRRGLPSGMPSAQQPPPGPGQYL